MHHNVWILSIILLDIQIEIVEAWIRHMAAGHKLRHLTLTLNFFHDSQTTTEKYIPSREKQREWKFLYLFFRSTTIHPLGKIHFSFLTHHYIYIRITLHHPSALWLIKCCICIFFLHFNRMRHDGRRKIIQFFPSHMMHSNILLCFFFRIEFYLIIIPYYYRYYLFFTKRTLIFFTDFLFCMTYLEESGTNQIIWLLEHKQRVAGQKRLI